MTDCELAISRDSYFLWRLQSKRRYQSKTVSTKASYSLTMTFTLTKALNPDQPTMAELPNRLHAKKACTSQLNRAQHDSTPEQRVFTITLHLEIIQHHLSILANITSPQHTQSPLPILTSPSTNTNLKSNKTLHSTHPSYQHTFHLSPAKQPCPPKTTTPMKRPSSSENTNGTPAPTPRSLMRALEIVAVSSRSLWCGI